MTTNETSKIQISGKEKALLEDIAASYQEILQNKLVGIYVHGSLAFGCFNWDKSDIDFLVITNSIPTQKEKIMMVQKLIDLEPSCPKKGFEMSIVLEKYCKHFVYPTPYELHFSNTYLSNAKENIDQYCQRMQGTDKDLAAHFTVTKAIGITIYGENSHDIFTSEIPKADFLDSVILDIENAKEEMRTAIQNHDNATFVYITLNLCRVLAYVKDNAVISKEDGGNWGLSHLSNEYEPVISAALASYTSGLLKWADSELTEKFVQYMISQIMNK
ncbi:hypothetical protein M9Y10_025091 [Tritrichomonas musculus]|uniref:Streptomycin 3''-adenylyltransferase n=1 Tax=Tritrichomonas musculus TaxID=1915356 RepID=A0ABR2HBE9_9EUKA